MRRPVLAALLAALGLVPSARAAIVDACRWPPPGGTAVAPESTDVMMTPMVGDLDGDGIPEIVVVSFVDADDINRGQDGMLRVLSGADCSELASVPSVGCVSCVGEPACLDLDERGDAGFLCPGCGVAVGDVDGDGLLEIAAVAEGPDELDASGETRALRRVVLFDHRGELLWCSEEAPGPMGAVASPALADLDGDGSAEIMVRDKVFNGDGTLRWAVPVAGLGTTTVADLTGDGAPEVIPGDRALHADGSVLWDRPDLHPAQPAVADFDLDCKPEVVTVSRRLAQVTLLDGLTGATRCEVVLPGGLETCPSASGLGQGGAPTLADVDGDCIPEIGVAGCRQYSLYRFDPTAASPGCLELIWSADTTDLSSRITGSTIFDLDADGRFEVLYNDEETIWIFDALTGAVLDAVPNSNSTLIENPTLVDADGDGDAEIVVSSNDYHHGTDVGIRVLHDPNVAWAPTRSVYNQHAYHFTNVSDAGGIPAVEEDNWERYNNFRVQVTPTGCDLAGCPLATGTCDARTQGFWKRQCAGPHPSGEHELLGDRVAFVSSFATFADVADVSALCDRLHPDPRSDKCEQAEAQFMALLLNVASGRVDGACAVSSDGADAGSALELASLVDALLSDDGRTRDACVLAQALSAAFNEGESLTGAMVDGSGGDPDDGSGGDPDDGSGGDPDDGDTGSGVGPRHRDHPGQGWDRSGPRRRRPNR